MLVGANDMANLEDKYSRFFRDTNIDLLEELSSNGGGGSGVTDHGDLTGLDADDHPQYLNEERADARFYGKTQVDDLLTPLDVKVSNLGVDFRAQRFGCKFITSFPQEVPNDSTAVSIAQNRLYMYRLAVPAGVEITGFKFPIYAAPSGGGQIRFGLYAQDNTKLGESGDVYAQLEAATVPGWVTVDLTEPVESTGPVWIVFCSTASGPSMQLLNVGAYPDWLMNPVPNALYQNDVGGLPATLDPEAGTNYRDVVIGIY